jgi:hypothetical protein
MATTMFALGVLTMVMVTLITVTVVGAVKVLKLQKQLKELYTYIHDIERYQSDRFVNTERNMDQRITDMCRDINMIESTMSNGIKNTTSYIDSRIDKLIDTYFQVKEAEQQSKKLIKG